MYLTVYPGSWKCKWPLFFTLLQPTFRKMRGEKNQFQTMLIEWQAWWIEAGTNHVDPCRLAWALACFIILYPPWNTFPLKSPKTLHLQALLIRNHSLRKHTISTHQGPTVHLGPRTCDHLIQCLARSQSMLRLWNSPPKRNVQKGHNLNPINNLQICRSNFILHWFHIDSTFHLFRLT